MWQKKGLVFDINQYKSETIQSDMHPFLFALQIKDKLFYIYYSSRNKAGKSLPYYVTCNIENGLIEILGEPSVPLLDLGEPGTFDDSGMMPSCLIRHDEKIYMYYIGWNPQVTVSYRLSIGLAISTDGGKSFSRYSKGPVCDRSLEEPFFNTAPFVMIENGLWRMWYISCTQWQTINNYPEPSYHVKYAESKDGYSLGIRTASFAWITMSALKLLAVRA